MFYRISITHIQLLNILKQLLNNCNGLERLLGYVYIRKQSGAVEACWAHNPEVRGSKPRSATF